MCGRLKRRSYYWRVESLDINLSLYHAGEYCPLVRDSPTNRQLLRICLLMPEPRSLFDAISRILHLHLLLLHLCTMAILPANRYKKDASVFSRNMCLKGEATMDRSRTPSPQYKPSTGKGEIVPERNMDTMSKTACREKLKHQLEIWRRLQQLGLFAAATESRKKAHVLLQIYKRHFREQLTS